MESSGTFKNPPGGGLSPSNALPKTHQFIQTLGGGVFGTVWKCHKVETGEFVAVKTPLRPKTDDLRYEASVMKMLMQHKMDSANIVKFNGVLFVNKQLSLEYEALDLSLHDYIKREGGRMRLEEIRTVIQQLASALSALKTINLIHTDVKTDNIMMVDLVNSPSKVKLIDFGLAIFSQKVKPGLVVQPRSYRSPEVILELPFSEAIDIWALGCVMAIMLCGSTLFPGTNNMQYMIDLLGAPPDHLLDASGETERYFQKVDDKWVLKDNSEKSWLDCRNYHFRSLDKMKMVRLEVDNPREAEDRRECIELLKVMLTWDPEDRITPSGILNHPFITRSYLTSSPYLNPRTRIRKLCRSVVPLQPAALVRKRWLKGKGTSCRSPTVSRCSPSSIIQFDPDTPATVEEEGKGEGAMPERKRNVFHRVWTWMKQKFTTSRVAT